jgi:uncharacterized membrane protein HdeD (DUF308 family)
MLKALAKNWWVFLLRGVVAVLLGLTMWFNPATSLAVMVMFFGAWMLVDGIFTGIVAIVGRKDNAEWGWLLTSGIMSLLIGVLTLRAPGVTIVVLALFIAAWAFMLGISQIALGWRIRKEVKNEWMLYLGGAVALLFGISMLWDPAAGAVSIVWMIALFALFLGISLIMLAFRLKGLRAGVSAGR